MRSFPAVILFSLFLFLVLTSGQCGPRQKRFLRTDFLNPLSDSLVGLGDYARDLSDQLSSHASMAVQHVMPQAARALTRLTPWGHRNREVQQGPLPSKKNLLRIPVEREREDEEVEIIHPEERPPQRPSFGIGNSFIPFSFSFGFLTPWWEGENVCEERNEVDEPEQETQNFTGFSINFETTRCIPSESSYVCTKKIQTNGLRRTIVVRRQCCHGFIRRTDGRPGCSALKMENLYDTMRSLEMTKFLNWMENSGLKEKLLSENLTVFSPSNEAIVDFEDDTEDNEISAINPAKLTDIAPTVSGHVVEGFVNIDSVEDEQLLDTIHEQQTKIRINKYQASQEVVTANCIPISGKNNLATNGIVHLASGVLPLLQSSVVDILNNNQEYSKFKKLLEESNLWDDLKKEDQPWTLFIPTNAAFQKLPSLLQRQIESGEGCVESILHQHIVKGTICTAAIISQNKVKNILGNSLQLTKDEEEKLRVEGVLMDSSDIVVTNGVIHEIDSVLIPPQARNLLKAIEEEERQDLLDLIETAGLISELEKSDGVTFFLPTKEAIKSLPNETKEEMLNNPQYLKSVLQHHLVQEHLPSAKFMDNSKFTTVGGHNLHLKLHELFPGIVSGATVQCAFLMSHDNQACGALIHKINKVLIPPKGSIVEVLQDMEGHSIVLKLLKNTDLESKLKEEGPFTFLAPSDDAFERMTESSLDDLLENNTLAEDILKLHVLPEVLCCNGVPHSSPFHRQFVRTFDGSILPLHRGMGDRVRFGRARAQQCDISATNGLVHSINRVIQRQKQRSNIFTMDLWPFF